MDKTMIEQVAEFHELMGVKRQDNIFDNDYLLLRGKLVVEEFEELSSAADNKDKVETLDGICDCLYVLIGWGETSFGKDVLQEAFNRVHESNMSKFLDSEDQAEKECKVLGLNGIKVTYNKVGEKYILRRSSDGKVVKPSTYKKVDLTDLVK